jgi:hypothetical protein
MTVMERWHRCSLTVRVNPFVRTGSVLTVIAVMLVMLLGATYWRWLGYA